MIPQEAQQLRQRVTDLENLLGNLTYNGEYRFTKNVNFGPNAKLDGNLTIGETASKIGLYGVAPIARQTAITSPSGGTTVDSQARTAINTIILTLKNVGITF